VSKDTPGNENLGLSQRLIKCFSCRTSFNGNLEHLQATDVFSEL